MKWDKHIYRGKVLLKQQSRQPKHQIKKELGRGSERVVFKGTKKTLKSQSHAHTKNQLGLQKYKHIETSLLQHNNLLVSNTPSCALLKSRFLLCCYGCRPASITMEPQGLSDIFKGLHGYSGKQSNYRGGNNKKK